MDERELDNEIIRLLTELEDLIDEYLELQEKKRHPPPKEEKEE